jgi:hypothetical protein
MARRVSLMKLSFIPLKWEESDADVFQDGELVAGITAYADGPDEMREVIRHHIDLGVDQIKLSMSGEEVSHGCNAK